MQISLIQRALRRIIPQLDRGSSPSYEGPHAEIVKTVKPYTMTSNARLVALCDAVEYIERNQIVGDFVECGVWRGGSSMAMMLKLLELENLHRNVHLFDTFEGMSEPTDVDIDVLGNVASEQLRESDRESSTIWAYASRPDVEQAVNQTGYPEARINFIEGKVECTVPEKAPKEIALLRLDTDWYESTKHELTHLYPRLVPYGVLIIDDYGHWTGAKKAVDEFLESLPHPLHLIRIDYTGRIAIKPSA